MAGGKRASMREGPLSALFKRTDVESPEEREDHRPDRRPAEGRERVEPERREEQPEAELDYAQPRIPSPKERLSAAFSQDIPHDVLERPQGAREQTRQYRPRDEPVITR